LQYGKYLSLSIYLANKIFIIFEYFLELIQPKTNR